jgi:CubicO group peptidase (beta-lactamase class C family)
MKAFSIVTLILAASACHGQQTTDLALSTRSNHEIAPGEKHSYNVNLKANQFSVLVVIQDGTDLMVRVHDPSGTELGVFDSPNGQHGPEVVQIASTVAGAYKVVVEPLSPDEPKGKYTIELTRQEAKATTPEKQVEQLMSLLTTPDKPGATIAVAKGDQLLLNKGFGLANPEYNIPNGEKTVYHIASVSKQFTAFSIAMLADQGKLSVDDEVRKYIPELPDFGHKITITQLLHHTSGLRDQWNLLALAGWRLDDVITKNQVLRLMSRQKDLNFKPGDEFSYCNTGYTLAAEIVSRVSGKSFDEWTQENIFKPLGMTNTFFYEDHERIVKNRAYSFYETGDGLKKSVLSYSTAGATSLFTTAEDLVKWSNNFRTMKVGNAKIMAQMEERGILNKGDTTSYAFGQDLNKYKGLKTASHGGGDAGYRTFLLRFPDQQYTFVVLSNLASFNTGKVAYQLADIYLKDLVQEEEKKTPSPEEPKSDAIQVSTDLLKLYSGQYELQPGFVVTMRLESDHLVAQATNQPSFTLVPKSESEFFIAAINAKITFNRNNQNQVNEFILDQNGNKTTAKRLKEFNPANLDLKKYTGIYYSPELETRYTLAIENGVLVANHIRHEPSKLTPVSETIFNCDAWFMGRIEFTINEYRLVDGMKVSSGRVKDVKFVKVEK